jgi:hypothetical protein
LGLGGSAGSNGSMIDHNSSSIKGFAMSHSLTCGFC